MSDLLKELREPVVTPRFCQFAKIIQVVSDEEAETIKVIVEELRDAMDGTRISIYTFEWLAGTLTKHGHTISGTTISRHVRRKCACERP